MHLTWYLYLTILHDKQKEGQRNKYLPHIGKLGSQQNSFHPGGYDFNQGSYIVHHSHNAKQHQIGIFLASPVADQIDCTHSKNKNTQALYNNYHGIYTHSAYLFPFRTFSSSNNATLYSNPSEYPTILPSLPMTLWHGTIISTGFFPTAPPTA